MALSEPADSPPPSGKRGPHVDILRDVSAEVCWVGGWTKDLCCRGDATTREDCWGDRFSFAECCPNADCWTDLSYTYEQCCDTAKFGESGNAGCWGGAYNYEHCCLAKRPAQSWVEVLTSGVDTEQFYTMDEFYTDAQYGEDFGYYSTGRVLHSLAAQAGEAHQFAHFTTFPMAMSPHFGRVMCRLLFLAWLQLAERAPFRVVEMGAGSGQLAYDVQQCVRWNELGISPAVWRRWAAAFEYLIVERSPALAERQRQRGLRVVAGDAQSRGTCEPTLAALAALDARGAAGGAAGGRGGNSSQAAVGASVVFSNELLDAFAPVKLTLNLFGEPDVTKCNSWQEARFVHLLAEADLQRVARLLQRSEASIEPLTLDLRGYTSEVFCGITNTTVGQAAAECSPQSSCLAITFGLAELMLHSDLQLPSAAHNMRLRLRKDWELCHRFKDIANKLEDTLGGTIALPRQVYRQLRHQMREAPEVEVFFLAMVQTKQVPVPLAAQRCENLSWWFSTHKRRIMRLVDLYRPLGYPALQLLVRPGERDFVELADCLVGPAGGFMLSIDYGASFEALGHSLSVDTTSDGIFIPPVPQELLEDLPDCYGSWLTCAGRVDWTSFVDFTNVAAAGERLGWRTVFYGPQSALEHIGRRNASAQGGQYSVPGYPVLSRSWPSRHVQNWYGREALTSPADSAGWEQRWTSFKALLLERPAAPGQGKPRVAVFPSWHLDGEEADACWPFDPTSLPLADWIARHPSGEPRAALEQLTEETLAGLGKKYAEAYEEAQLAVQIVDWLVAAEGCGNFRPPRAAALLRSGGLWQALRRRLLRAWEDIWGAEAVERIALALLRRLAGELAAGAGARGAPAAAPAGARAGVPGESPAECIAAQTYEALCGAEGDGVQARELLYFQA